MNINKKINEIINVQLMIINVQNNARSAPKLKTLTIYVMRFAICFEH